MAISELKLAEIVGGDTPLFHGTPSSSITAFKKGIEDTLGTGIYFTSERKKAEGYAVKRTCSDGVPFVYEARAPYAKFLDLRDAQTLAFVLEGYVGFANKWLEKKYPEEEITNANIRFSRNMLARKIKRITERIKEGKCSVGNIRTVSYEIPYLWTEYIQSLGYEGLIGLEGGEDNIGNHDSWLVFDPEKTLVEITGKNAVER